MANLSIGEIARILNVSRRTLRYYEEVGIVVPKARGTNNYRYYDTTDLNRLQAVMLMRRAGLSLREVLDTVGPALIAGKEDLLADDSRYETGQMLATKIQERLIGQQKRLADKISELQATWNAIEKSLQALQTCLECETSLKLVECADCGHGCSDVVEAAARCREHSGCC